MTNEREKREPDRFASGTRGTDIDEAGKDDPNPGVTGGQRTYLPGTAAEETPGTAASSAEGTIGAVGAMDITGAPAGVTGSGGVSGGSSAGETEGGGTGGGARSGGGTGPGVSGEKK
jgi:hypothetical protein